MIFNHFSRTFIVLLLILFAAVGNAVAIDWKPMKLAIHEKEARRLFSFLEARPNNPDIFQKIGKLYDSDGNTEEAIVWYERAAKIAPAAELLTIIADRYGWINRPKDMLKTLKRLLSLQPGNAEVLQKMAQVAGWAGDPSSAGAAYETSFLNSRDPEFLRKAVASYLEARQPDKAKKVLNRLIRIQPKNPKNYEQLADVLQIGHLRRQPALE